MVKDKKDRSMTFRLTEEEYSWLEKASFTMGITPSKMVRQMIQISINAQKAAEKRSEEIQSQLIMKQTEQTS